ncbi:adenylate/guanylate cyclase domain-containing protein [Lentisphaerota bacterium ZTH]|nr:adenylate/guanylate cyclase domain-containing response regulator [Lentisphaerota bacterium]WET07521.1 adenylate/guanylate cyclase domain-containing protein [Lentisphaerota bacterium ZTH]
MIHLLYIIAILILTVCYILTTLYFISRGKKRADNLKRNFEKDRQNFLSETLTPIHESEEEKLKIAEANLKLLEQQEKLQEQKLEMAEANLKLLELKEQVEYEKERSEKLLLNILPARVAHELKETGRSVPESFDNVTVFFSDIVDFTRLTSTIDPADVINELSDIFTEFDKIFSNNHCERIKTIGDAYLSVSGMPTADTKHFSNILNAALEAMEFLHKRNSGSGLKWHMRMGVHSGSVVGGIVGVEKYIYDVFGDTINTAARMERYSEPMRINVSEDTYQLAKEEFKFIERIPVEVKGKGTVKMYFLEKPA